MPPLRGLLPMPRTRAERQAVNFKAPVVAKAKLANEAASARPSKALPKAGSAQAVDPAKPKTKPSSRRARWQRQDQDRGREEDGAQLDRQGESQAQGAEQDRQTRAEDRAAMSGIFANAKLVVVKVGSALLVDGARGELRRDWLASLCDDVAALKKQGVAVVLVSSGSIALGRRLLKLASGELRLEESQAAAAAGQVRLAEAYADMFASRGIVAAQVLLTFGDTEERRRYLNARATLGTLWAWARCR